MKNTVAMLAESELSLNIEKYQNNKSIFESFDSITESQRQLTGFVPEKVIVLVDESSNYLVEFTNNIERLMKDQSLNLIEAMTEVCDVNNIPLSKTTLVLDESCLDKIDLDFGETEFKIATM